MTAPKLYSINIDYFRSNSFNGKSTLSMIRLYSGIASIGHLVSRIKLLNTQLILMKHNYNESL